MLRAVVDTNVFVTALLRGATARRVYDAFLHGTFTLVFSRNTLAELIDVLTRPSLRVLTCATEVTRLLALIRRDGLLVRPTRAIRACRDPKDNIFLECAIAGRVDCLVTGDLDLLTLHPFRGIHIIRPAEFVRRLF